MTEATGWSTEPAKQITKGIATEQFASVDDYISTFPLDVQTALQAVRKTINAAAPGAKESISYQIPAFSIGGAASRLPGLLEETHQPLHGTEARRGARCDNLRLHRLNEIRGSA